MEEAVLGFKEEPTSQLIVEEDKSCGYKLVPWINWEEWTFVRDSLFSSSPNSISTALRRISAWRSRGCVPVVVDVTASIIEIQQKDPFFRNGISDDALHSEEMLAMLYCMAIMRLVNGVVEKMRKKNEVSIGEAADAIGIPRMLIDIRHEGSHRDLPSLRLVRLASIKALDWLKYYYWEPQKMSIPSDRTANIRKEIKSTLRELAFSIKTKQTTRSSSSVVKQKRVRQRDHLCSRNKFLFLMSGKLQSSKPAGFKKQINRMLKNLIRLYYSFSSEVISVLLEFLMKALDSVLIQGSEVSHSSNSLQAVIDEWKPVIIKLSNKEPEFLLTLLKAVLDMIETREAAKYDFGGSSSGPEQLTPEFSNEFQKTDRLSYLLEWLASNLTGLKETETKDSSRGLNMPKSTIIELLHKCLLVSSPGNNNLTSTAFILARITGNNSLVDKLNKLTILHSSNVDINEENPSLLSPERFLCQQEDSIHRAAEKLKSFKLQLLKRNNMNRGSESEGCKNRWSTAKSWNACPIGMLPRDVGSSGHLPFLECNEDVEKGVRLLEREEKFELEKCSGKREAEYGVESLDDLSVKKMKESEVEGGSNEEGEKLAKGVEGRLMIGGVLREVREEEVFAIASAVRVLV